MSYEEVLKLLQEFDYNKNDKESLINFLKVMLYYLEA